MALGIRSGMGVEARQALREKWALKLGIVSVVFHSCDTHDCDSHGNHRGGGSGDEAPSWMSDSEKRIYGKLKGGVRADFLKQAEAAYKKKHGKAPPKAAPRKAGGAAAFSTPELVEKRRAFIEDKKKWGYFPEEVGELVGTDVEVRGSEIRAEHWLTKAQFLKLKGLNREGREVSALEQAASPACHGHVVERGGRYLNPFGYPDGPGHVAYRLEQFDMAREMLDKGGLAARIKKEPAFSVELKSNPMAGGRPRDKNRLYLLDVAGGKPVALNVVVQRGNVTAALVEWADGSFADMASVRRALGKVKPLTNNIIPVKDFK